MVGLMAHRRLDPCRGQATIFQMSCLPSDTVGYERAISIVATATGGGVRAGSETDQMPSFGSAGVAHLIRPLCSSEILNFPFAQRHDVHGLGI